MGASGVGGGGKRNVNADLNLVPYIDLLSTLICFLLITAVWQQLEVLSTSGQNSTSSENPAPPDPNHVDLSVSLFEDRIELLAGNDKQSLPFISGEPDEPTLIIKLLEWKKKMAKPLRHCSS